MTTTLGVVVSVARSTLWRGGPESARRRGAQTRVDVRSSGARTRTRTTSTGFVRGAAHRRCREALAFLQGDPRAPCRLRRVRRGVPRLPTRREGARERAGHRGVHRSINRASSFRVRASSRAALTTPAGARLPSPTPRPRCDGTSRGPSSSTAPRTRTPANASRWRRALTSAAATTSSTVLRRRRQPLQPRRRRSLTETRATTHRRAIRRHGISPSTRPTRLFRGARVYLDVADARTGAGGAPPQERGARGYTEKKNTTTPRRAANTEPTVVSGFPSSFSTSGEGGCGEGGGGRGRVRAVPPRPRVRARDEVDGDQHEHRAPRERHDARGRAEAGPRTAGVGARAPLIKSALVVLDCSSAGDVLVNGGRAARGPSPRSAPGRWTSSRNLFGRHGN